MHRLATLAILCLGLVVPAQAFDPVTLIAKEIVKQVIRDFIQNRVEASLRATLGPCRMAMAEMGVGPDAALVKGVRKATSMGLDSALGAPGASFANMPGMDVMKNAAGAGGMPNMPNMAGLPNTTGMPQVPGMTGLPQMPAGLPNLPNLPQMPGMPAEMAGVAAMAGVPGAGMAMPSMGGITTMPMGADAGKMQELMQSQGSLSGLPPGAAMSPQMMAMVQQMSTQGPLSPAEADELGEHFYKIAKAFPDMSECSPEDTRTFIKFSATMPMTSGMMRPILDAMRQMDASFAEARQTFAQMTPEQRQEYVAVMTDDLSAADEEQRKLFLRMIEGDLFGMPEEMRAELQAALR